MNKIIWLLVVVIFLSVTKNSLSQEISDTVKNKKIESVKNSLEKGKWALQFTIDQNFTLSNFEGSIASVKKQLSPNRALRLGLSLEFFHNKSEQRENTRTDTTHPDNGKHTDFSVFIYPTYLFYVNPQEMINLYFGAGITLGGRYHWTENKQDLIIGYNYYYNYSRSYSYGGGLTGAVGVEFFPLKNFSIIAEYFASFQYSHSIEKNIRDYPGDFRQTESNSDSFEFFGKRVNFGLSVYF